MLDNLEEIHACQSYAYCMCEVDVLPLAGWIDDANWPRCE